MSIQKKSRGIRLRIVLIYCLLVFIATTIIGVFIMSQTEDYLRGTIGDNMRNSLQEGTLLSSLLEYEEIENHQEEIQRDVDAWGSSLKEEIFVVDKNFQIVAATNENAGFSALGLLDEGLILEGLSGKEGESETALSTSEGTIPVLNMVFPIKNQEQVVGAVYLRADLSSIDDAMASSKEIFAKGMALGLLATIILGFFISKSITEPIKQVTEKAERMAQGDFSEEVSVRSNDEIGELANMFNLLRLQLNKTISEMSNEKNKLETVLSHMADGLIAMDLQGNIIHANQAAMDILKIGSQEGLISNYDQLVDGILNEGLNLESLRTKAASGPKIESFETGGFIYNLRYDKFKDEDGKEIGLILILQDITQRHKLEYMQMDFVANVSHELKTPLTTIKSYTETLMDGCPEDPQITNNFLQIIDSETDRMARLVRDLLQLSRLEYKQEQMHKQVLDLTELLKTSVLKVKLQSEGKSQQLNSLFNPGKEALAFVDKDRMEQVFMNLLSNAIKYTEPGGRIDVDLSLKDEEIRITVKDNGIGIPKEDVSRVFERFFRVDKARSGGMGGTGLGLAITKQIVEEHEGKIIIDSIEGKGTTVVIVLPWANLPEEPGLD
jgi:two-component system sensor histidine kinase VicK